MNAKCFGCVPLRASTEHVARWVRLYSWFSSRNLYARHLLLTENRPGRGLGSLRSVQVARVAAVARDHEPGEKRIGAAERLVRVRVRVGAAERLVRVRVRVRVRL